MDPGSIFWCFDMLWCALCLPLCLKFLSVIQALMALWTPGSLRQCLCSVQAERPCCLNRRCLNFKETWDIVGQCDRMQDVFNVGRHGRVSVDFHWQNTLQIDQIGHAWYGAYAANRKNTATFGAFGVTACHCNLALRLTPPWHINLCIRKSSASPKWRVHWSLSEARLISTVRESIKALNGSEIGLVALNSGVVCVV